MTTDTEAITQSVATRLAQGPERQAWAACAEVWSRWWVLAGPAWRRRPDAGQRVHEALATALRQAAGMPIVVSIELVLLGLEALDFEDDGSAEWQYAIDLAADLLETLSQHAPSPDAERTIRTYLEGEFNVAANALADRSGRPVSHADALYLLDDSVEWQRAVSFVTGLA